MNWPSLRSRCRSNRFSNVSTATCVAKSHSRRFGNAFACTLTVNSSTSVGSAMAVIVDRSQFKKRQAHRFANRLHLARFALVVGGGEEVAERGIFQILRQRVRLP